MPRAPRNRKAAEALPSAPPGTNKRRRRKPKKPQAAVADDDAAPQHAHHRRHAALALLPSELYTFLSPSWRPTPSFLAAPTPLSSLRCLTYNTFSSSPTHSPHQTTALLRVLHEARFDIAALQEVTPAFFAALQKAGWTKEYALSGAQEFLHAAGHGGGGWGKEGGPEAVVLLVRRELVGAGSRVGFVRMPTGRGEGGKALVVLRLFSRGEEQLRVVSSHFSSLPHNASLRTTQYQLALSHLSHLSPTSVPSLLLADFNNSSHAELSPLASLSDCFPSLPSSDLFRTSPTFGELYPLIPGAARNKPRKVRRIDRVLIGGEVRCVGYEEVGREHVRGGGARVLDWTGKDGWAWPSDHVGVLVQVEVRDEMLGY